MADVLGRFGTFLDVFGCFGTFLGHFRTLWDVLHHYFLDKFKLVWNNPVNSCHTKVDKSKLVWNNPDNSRHTKLDKSKVGLGWLEWVGWAALAGWSGLAGLAGLGFGMFLDVLERFRDILGHFGTFWDVLRCIASLFSRQVQTRLKQSCQFASYKTRQVQSQPWLAGVGWLGWVLGRFRTFWDVLGCFEMYCTTIF